MKINSSLIKLLTAIRDSRLLWNVLGPIYNRRIYDAIFELYEAIAQKLDVPAQARILDVGSGSGYVSLRIAACHPQATLTGVDFSPTQVRAAKRLCYQKNISNCMFIVGNVLQLPFQDGRFDAAVSVGSIKHWPDAHAGLREIHRVLKPGGRLIISETDQDTSDEALKRFIQRFQVWFVPERLLLWGLRHVIFGQSYSQSTLAAALGRAGFRDIEGWRVASCPYTIVNVRK